MDIIRRQIVEMADSPIIDVWRMGFTVPDVIGLWAGEPDLPTPEFICKAASDALFAGHTFYTHNRGIPELRGALARYLRRLYDIEVEDGRLAITSSGMNAVNLVAQAVIDPGDRAVVVTPAWPNVDRALAIAGAQVTQVPLRREPAGWTLDRQALYAACGDKTKLVYLASPANPTGWMLEPHEARELVEFARAKGIVLLADEVYHRLVHDRPVAPSLLHVARPDDPVFIVNSFSKAWAMTGWRMGWLVAPEGCRDALEKLIQFNTSGGQAFLQYGAIAALDQGEDFVRHFVERCARGRDVVAGRLDRMARVRRVPNEASFYTMFEVEGVTDTVEFCKRAVSEARIGMAPGLAFGKGAETLIRLCHAKAPPLLDAAMDRLERFVSGYRLV